MEDKMEQRTYARTAKGKVTQASGLWARRASCLPDLYSFGRRGRLLAPETRCLCYEFARRAITSRNIRTLSRKKLTLLPSAWFQQTGTSRIRKPARCAR